MPDNLANWTSYEHTSHGIMLEHEHGSLSVEEAGGPPAVFSWAVATGSSEASGPCRSYMEGVTCCVQAIELLAKLEKTLMPIHPKNRAENIEAAGELLSSLVDEDLFLAVAGLIELAKGAASNRGFQIVIDPDEGPKLEDRKSSGDYYLEGLSLESLTAIVNAIGHGC